MFLLHYYILTWTHGPLEEIIVHSAPGEKDREKFMDKSTGLEMDSAEEAKPLLEWFAEKYKEFGATLEFVTNKSQEGSQFVKGFGGIGGILRYKVDFTDLGDLEGDDDEFYGSDDDSGWWFPGLDLNVDADRCCRYLTMSNGRYGPA